MTVPIWPYFLLERIEAMSPLTFRFRAVSQSSRDNKEYWVELTISDKDIMMCPFSGAETSKDQRARDWALFWAQFRLKEEMQKTGVEEPTFHRHDIEDVCAVLKHYTGYHDDFGAVGRLKRKLKL